MPIFDVLPRFALLEHEEGSASGTLQPEATFRPPDTRPWIELQPASAGRIQTTTYRSDEERETKAAPSRKSL